jgi:hypothetical protein
MNKKNLLAILAGFVVSFLLGWLIYGMMLMDYMNSAVMPGLNKPEEGMIWWAMILSMLAGTILLNYVVSLAGANNFMKGATTALWVGLLMALSYDLYFWGGTNMYTKMEIICIDPLISGAMAAITGGVMGWVRGAVDKPAAATA